MPAPHMCYPRTRSSYKGSANIDPHIENRKPTVCPRVIISIKLPNHTGNMGLKKTISTYNQCHTAKKTPTGRKSQYKMSQRHEYPSKKNSLLITQQPIGYHTAKNRHSIN